jgi:hypothetical protein
VGHVGIVTVSDESPANKKIKERNEETASTLNDHGTGEQVFLFDLGSSSALAPGEASAWVKTSFERMKRKAGQ